MALARTELGSPDAPALVLVHGLGASGRSLERIAPLLASRFRVIVPDLPGFGATGGPPASVAPPDRVTRLVLVNTPPTYASRTAARGRAERLLRLPVLGDLLWRSASDDRVRTGMRSAFAPGHDVPDVFVEDLRRTTRAAYTGASDAIDDYVRHRPLPERIGALTQDALIVFGEHDGRVDPAALDGYGAVANATVVTIPEAGHTPIWEAPERTAELIGMGAGAR